MNESIKMLNNEVLLGDMLDNRANKLSAEAAAVFHGKSISYSDFKNSVEALATSFLKMGLSSEDRIAIILPTRPEFLYVWLAASKIGASVVGLNVRYRENEIIYMCNDSKPTVLVCINEFADLNYGEFLTNLLPKIPSIQHFIFFGDTGFNNAIDFENLLKESPDFVLLSKQQPKEDADNFLIYTSGSTGKPKGAVLTQKSILAMIRPWVNNLALIEDDRFLCVLPLNHVGGATICAMSSLASGATMIMHDVFNPSVVLNLINEQQVTIAAGVPTMYATLFTLPDFDKDYLSSIRMAIYGGAAASPELLESMNKLMNCRIIGTYGSTEVSGFCTYTTKDDPFEKILTTVGKAPQSVELKIVDPETRSLLDTEEIGEVAIKGELLFNRYLNMPEETSNVFDNEGWFYSGDMGHIDQDGYLTLAGRLNEMYITGGFNVYPKEIEDVLCEHPSVAMAAVVGVHDDIKGEIGWGFVMKVPGSNVSEEGLKEYCQSKIAKYKVPTRIFIEDNLPMTALGKIHKPTLLEKYL